MTALLLVWIVPFMLCGLVLFGSGGLGLCGLLFGWPREHPSRWPDVEATVLDYRACRRGRSRRNALGHVPSQWVQVYVLIGLPGGLGRDVAEVTPPGARVLLQRPDGMSSSEFVARADELVVAEVRRIYPVGSTLRVVADPQRNSIGFSEGRFTVQAHCREADDSKVRTVLWLSMIMLVGAAFMLVGSLPLWIVMSGQIE